MKKSKIVLFIVVGIIAFANAQSNAINNPYSVFSVSEDGRVKVYKSSICQPQSRQLPNSFKVWLL